MCGFAGFIDSSKKLENPKKHLEEMTSTLAHRGPDDSGLWFDKKWGVGLGHRRLSIIDLSSTGHQPMHSPSKRYTIAYNGEIYNFQSLRSELAKSGAIFVGSSDTEVMLAAIEAWGLDQALAKFVGMFVFALWDQREAILYLVRDRLGIKPLYYGWANGAFVFASELKAICRYPGFSRSIDREALALFMQHNYVPAPHTIYEGISKLLPGNILSCYQGDIKQCQIRPYWCARAMARQGAMTPFSGTIVEATAEIERLLEKSVTARMISDVPLGAFLSGGIDSSTVVALMQKNRSDPVKTFSIGFDEQFYNEAEYAKKVAIHLGTEHTEMYVTPAQAMEVIPKLSSIYDEPFADSSQIPTFLVSQLARRHVKVGLSGDGGDELFCGYDRYSMTANLWSKICRIPWGVRLLMAQIIRSLTRCTQTWSSFALLPKRYRNTWKKERLLKLSRILACKSPAMIYPIVTAQWQIPDALVKGVKETTPQQLNEPLALSDCRLHMMLIDLLGYLPDDILTKVDRASMAVGLEARLPLLDHQLVEFAWQLPLSCKVRNKQPKWLLRQILYKYVPRDLVERPKKGFRLPIEEWLRGPLRHWAEELLSPKKLQQQGYLYPAPVSEKWQQHITGKYRWHTYLWTVLMFQSWLESQT